MTKWNLVQIKNFASKVPADFKYNKILIDSAIQRGTIDVLHEKIEPKLKKAVKEWSTQMTQGRVTIVGSYSHCGLAMLYQYGLVFSLNQPPSALMKDAKTTFSMDSYFENMECKEALGMK